MVSLHSPNDVDSASGSSNMMTTEKGPVDNVVPLGGTSTDVIKGTHVALKRGLTPRHLQLFAIGGVIGTGLFLGTGSGLATAGPLNLLLAFAAYSAIIWAVAQGVGEISTFIPVDDAYLMWANRFGGKAYAAAVSWNYIYTEITIAAAEITAVSGCMAFWVPDINPAVWVTVILILYTLMNVFPVKYYGEFEFWFSSFKVLLILGLILMTFIMMLGGNPNHDRFGFRYWRDPGVMNAQYTTGALGRFAAFWSSLRLAGFTIGGPHFIAMTAPETINPRRNVPKTIRRIIWRIFLFYILGVLCVGILVPYNDEGLLKALATGSGVAYSPFVVGMYKHGLGSALPNIMNFLVLTSAASCGNASVFNACRALRTMSKEGFAPRFFSKTTQKGVPLNNLVFTLLLCCLTYMTASKSASTVFTWFISLSAVGLMSNYFFIMLSYIFWSRALKAQGFERSRLPFRGVATPIVIPIAMFLMFVILLTNGFGVFVKGNWSTQSFLIAYFGLFFPIFVFLVACIFLKGPKWVNPAKADIFAGVAEANADEAYWKECYVPPQTFFQKFMDWLF